jgi:mono/diheme cytochrome c family protein
VRQLAVLARRCAINMIGPSGWLDIGKKEKLPPPKGHDPGLCQASDGHHSLEDGLTNMVRKVELFAVGILAALAGAAGAQTAAPAIFTADQATQGAAVYQAQCAACHGGALEGVSGPALKGDQFKAMAQAQGLNAKSLLDVVSQSMPQSDPGSLTADQYNQIVAYILQQNGYPAGNEALTPNGAHLKDLDLSK